MLRDERSLDLVFRVIRGKYAKIVFETHTVFVYCVNARRAACGKGRGRGCVLFAFASAAPDPFLVRAHGTCRFPLHPRKDLTDDAACAAGAELDLEAKEPM